MSLREKCLPGVLDKQILLPEAGDSLHPSSHCAVVVL